MLTSHILYMYVIWTLNQGPQCWLHNNSTIAHNGALATDYLPITTILTLSTPRLVPSLPRGAAPHKNLVGVRTSQRVKDLNGVGEPDSTYKQRLGLLI